MLTRSSSHIVPVDRIEVSSYTMPTDFPESDGTFEWNKTTLVLVRISAGGKQGLGYSYADPATASLIRDTLSKVLKGAGAMAPPAEYMAMWRTILASAQESDGLKRPFRLSR